MRVHDLEFEHVSDYDISVETWKELLTNKDIFSDEMLRILYTIYSFENHSANPLEIETIINISYNRMNIVIGNTGKKIKDYLNKKPIFNKNNEKGYPFIFVGYDCDNKFIFEIRKNLRIAMEAIFDDLEVKYRHSKLLDSVVDINDDDKEYDLISDLKEIVEKYPVLKKEKFGKTTFIKMIQDFNYNIQEFVNDSCLSSTICSKMHVSNGNWVKNPWIGIHDKQYSLENIFSFQNSFHLSYIINLENPSNPKLILELNQGHNNLNLTKDEIKQFLKELMFYVNYVPEGYKTILDVNLNFYTLLSKELEINNLTEELLEKEFRSLLYVFEHILPFHYKLMKKYSLKNIAKESLNDFKEIMDKYPQAMTEDQKNHPLAGKMRNDFKNDLKKLVESITDSDYNYRISPGRMGRWVNPPWAGIKSSLLSNTFTEGLYIIYHFRTDKNFIDLSINQGLDTIKRSEAINRARQLRKHVDLIDGFILDDDPDCSSSQTAILYKKYPVNNIDVEEFTNDLKNLLEVYENLLPYYNDMISETFPLAEEKDNQNINETNFWLFAPGPGASMWNIFYDKNVMAMAGDYLGNLTKYKTREKIVKALQRHNKNTAKYTNDSLAYWQMLHEIKQGDIIIAKKGIHEIIGYGIVTSDYFFDETLGEYAHAVSVDWKEKGSWHYKDNLITKTLTKITDYPDFVNSILNFFETYEDIKHKNTDSENNNSAEDDKMVQQNYGILNVNDRTIWKITPGSVDVRDDVWDECKDKGVISLGFSYKQNVDYTNFSSVDQLKEELLKINPDLTENTTAPQMVWNFVNEIRINDIVVANNDLNGKVYGIGIVESEYIAPDNISMDIDSSMKHIRRVNWIITDEFDTAITFDRKTITKLNNDKWNQIVESLLDNDENLKIQSLKNIFEEFKTTYYNSSQSEELRSKYSECTEKFRSDFVDIKISINDGNDETDNIFYNLIDPKDSLFKGLHLIKNR